MEAVGLANTRISTGYVLCPKSPKTLIGGSKVFGQFDTGLRLKFLISFPQTLRSKHIRAMGH